MKSAFDRIASGQPGFLFEATLEVATDEYPDLQTELYLEQMRVLAEAFDVYLGRAESITKILTSLNQFFFDELGFKGNSDHYYDPRNSYINEVLDRRLGIPISLSVLYRSLAASAGVTLDAISFPGHFLLAYSPPTGHRLYIDVFNQGRWLDWEECVRMARPIADVTELEEEQCPAVDDRDVLARMLRNLKAIYAPESLSRCLPIQKRLVQLYPKNSSELRDLGVLYYHLDKPMLAMKTLEEVVRRSPEFARQVGVQRYLSEATSEAVRLN